MNLKEQNVLLFPRTMGLGGTENVVLQICEILMPYVNKIIVCSCGGINVDALKNMKIKHYVIPDIENESLRNVLNVSRMLLHIVKAEKITAIHTHHRMASFYVSILRIYKRCHFICTAHNTFRDKKFLTRFGYKHANIIACGEMVKKNLTDYFAIPSKQVTVIHNAVKPFKGPYIEDEKIRILHSNGYFIVGNVGRLSEQKGFEYYIKALPYVLKKHSKVVFFIIGSGENENSLRKLACELGVGNAVCFMGYRTDVQNIMRQLDLIVLSSLWEGLPLTPIEAYSVGKTVIGTAVDGTPEVIRDNIDGYLVEPRNYQMLAEKIVYLIDHPKIRQQLETEALQRYNNKFSFMRMAETYLQYYRGII